MKGESIAIAVLVNGDKVAHVAKRIGITSPACSAAMHRFLKHKNRELYESLYHTSEYVNHTNTKCLPLLSELRKNAAGFAL